jgi:selenide,water dikinase
LTQVLRHLLPSDDPAVLVDASSVDDAAVYRIDEHRALVATVDFFTPIVDDPYEFGRIAAANALSDVYAMGARPLFALNLVGFPRSLLGEGLLEEIVRGGGEAARAAGVAVIGGHSVDDPEPKYGLAVVGEVDPDRIVRNSTARPGDVLVLTKAIGTGIIATAIKKEDVGSDTVRAAVDSMMTLNAGAARAMLSVGVNAATDVTGFGLLGHLHSLARASGVAARIIASAVPLLPDAAGLVQRGHVPGGTGRNMKDLEPAVEWDPAVDQTTRVLLCDAQTSGGLLIAVPADRASALLEALRAEHAPSVAHIGEIIAGPAGRLTVAP